MTGLNGAKASLGGYVVSLAASTLKTIGLTVATAALNAALTMGISVVATAATSAVMTWINSTKKITEDAEAAKEKIKSITDDLKNNSETVNNVKERYAELAQEVAHLGQVNQSQGSLTTDEYKEFLNISNQLAGIFPTLTQGYDDNGNALLKLSGNVPTIVSALDDLLRKEQELANQQVMKEFPDVFAGFNKTIKDRQGEVKSAKDQFDKLTEIQNQLKVNGRSVMTFDRIKGTADIFDNEGKKSVIALSEYLALLDQLNLKFKETSVGNGKGIQITVLDDMTNVLSDPEFRRKLDAAKQNLDYANSMLESERASLNSYFGTWLNTEFSYNNIADSGLQTAVQTMMTNFDFDDLPDNIDEKNWNQVSEYLRRNILYEIYEVQNDPEISKAISEIFTNQDLMPDEKANFLKQITDYFNDKLGKDNPIVLSLEPEIENTDSLNKSFKNTFDKFNKGNTDAINEEIEKEKTNLDNEYEKITSDNFRLGNYLDKIVNQTLPAKYGNVDMNNRTILNYDEKYLKEHADILKGWAAAFDEDGNIIKTKYDEIAEALKNGEDIYDTVWGQSSRFGEDLKDGGWEVAFTPILPDGTFLSADTVYDYIEAILKEAYADDGKVTDAELKKLDAEGRMIGDTFVQGIYAGVDDSLNYENNGNVAELIGRLMHFAGKFGAWQIGESKIDKAENKLGSKKIEKFFKEQKINTEEEKDAFEELTAGITDADEAIQKWIESNQKAAKIGGTLADIQEAFKSENSSTNWTELAGYLDKAKKLFDGGFIGTDDFQTVAQWMTPQDIDTSAYETPANAYADAWEKAYKKVSRWFNSEDQTASMWNFWKDLQAADSSLVDIDENTGRIQTHFKSTQEAANALGVSAEMVETILSTMSDYGFETDNIENSAQRLDEIKKSIADLQTEYDSLQTGSRKDRLGTLLENWNTQVDQFNGDLSQMSDGFEIPINFEYDLQQIYDAIDKIRNSFKYGNENREDYAEILGYNEQAITKLEEQSGVDQIENSYIDSLKQSIDNTAAKISEAVKNGADDSEIMELQRSIDKQQQIYQSILTSFNDWNQSQGFDISSATPDEWAKQWNDFLSEKHVLEIDTQIDNIDSLDAVYNALSSLQTGAAISFTANVDDVEQTLYAVKNEDGTIYFTADISDPEAQVSYIQYQDGTIAFSGDTSQAVNSVNETQQAVAESQTYIPVDADTSTARTTANTLIDDINSSKGVVQIDGDLSLLQRAWNWVAGKINPFLPPDSRLPIFQSSSTATSEKLPGTTVVTAKPVSGSDSGSKQNKPVSTSGITGSGNINGNLRSRSSANPSKSKSGSGGGKGGTGSGSEKDPTEFDWIERKHKLMEDELSKLKEQSSDTSLRYTGLDDDTISRALELFDQLHNQVTISTDDFSWLAQAASSAGMSLDEFFFHLQDGGGVSRMSVLQERLELDKKHIEEYTQDAQKYATDYEEAVSKLSPEYREKIEHGSNEVEELPDKENEAVKKAVDLYDKKKEAEQKVSDTQKDIHDTQVSMFDLEAEQLEKQNTELENRNSLISKQIDYLNTTGQLVSASAYESLIMNLDGQIANAEQQLELRKRELETLMQSNPNYKNSQEYYDLQATIQTLDTSIIDLTNQQAEYNDTLRQLPVNNMQKLVDMYNNISTAMENWKNEIESAGKSVGADYYQEQIKNGQLTIKQLQEQRAAVEDVMDEYETGSDKWAEMNSKLTDIDSSISSIVVNMNEWNEAMLQIPIDKMEKLVSDLQMVKDALDDVNSEHQTVISAVTGAIDDQRKAWEEAQKAETDATQDKIDAIQDQLDLLDKQNESLDLQIAKEQALKKLEDAKTQKKTRVIRDGQIVYEADQDAIRDAADSLQDAETNLKKHELQTEKEKLEDELDAINDKYDDLYDKLDKIANKWEKIQPDREQLSNEKVADRYLGDDWINKVLSGNDDDIYGAFKELYDQNVDSQEQYESQIKSTEQIQTLVNTYIEAYRSGTLTRDQAMTGIRGVLASVNHEITAGDNVNNILNYLSTQNSTGATTNDILTATQNQLSSTSEDIMRSLDVYEKNSNTITGYMSSFGELTTDVATMRSTINDVDDNLDNINSTLKDGFDDVVEALDSWRSRQEDDDDDDEKNGLHSTSHAGSNGWQDTHEFDHDNGKKGYEVGWTRKYANGIEEGIIGNVGDKEKYMAIREMATTDLKPSEQPILAHTGEIVLNPEQQAQLLRNIQQFTMTFKPETLNLKPVNVPTLENNTSQNIVMNFGDLSFPDVKDVDGFAKAVARDFPGLMRQAMSKTR